jgi:hypothetical protein
MHLNTEKSYLIGLLVGGGIIKSNSLQIVLPYKKWGDLKIEPQRGGGISEDILKRAKPLWQQHYKVDISYKIDSEWKIVFDHISSELKEDLLFLNLLDSGELRNNADLTKLIPLLDNEEKIRSFIAGIVDTVGSLAKSHRRFSDQFQIVSLEFKGRNFALVTDIAKLLVKINCVPDQILWNHPNQHSGLDRYYSSWKKGFKIRVALDDYILRGSFVFESKQLSATENQSVQKKQNTSTGKKSNIHGRTTLHVDENTDWLPESVRGLHFIHYTHIAEHLGLKLPLSSIDSISDYYKYVSPFTVLTKGTLSEVSDIIKDEEYLNKTSFRYKTVDLKNLLETFEKNSNSLLFGNTTSDGFPVNYILQGLAYVIASGDPTKVKGKRVLGSYTDLLKEVGAVNAQIGIPNKGTCLHIKNGTSAALVGYVNNEFTKTLVKSNGTSVRVSNPDFSKCIKLKYE